MLWHSYAEYTGKGCRSQVYLCTDAGTTGYIVGGKSLEGVKYGVCLRRLGLAGLGELRGLECRSTLKESRS